MKTLRFMSGIVLLLCATLMFVKCENKDIIEGRTVHHFIEKYFLPTGEKISIAWGEYGYPYCDLYMSYTSCIDDENSSEFKKLAEMYGEKGEKEFLFFAPPLSKPYNIKALRLLQNEGNEWQDISDKADLTYRDYSQYIGNRYEGKNYTEVQKKISELTEHDLKWLSCNLQIRFTQYEEHKRLALEFTMKDGKTFKKSLNEE